MYVRIYDYLFRGKRLKMMLSRMRRFTPYRLGNKSMYVCVCMCVHTYLYVCMYVCMCVCTYSTYVCMYVHVCTYVCMYVPGFYLRGGGGPGYVSPQRSMFPPQRKIISVIKGAAAHFNEIFFETTITLIPFINS